MYNRNHNVAHIARDIIYYLALDRNVCSLFPRTVF